MDKLDQSDLNTPWTHFAQIKISGTFPTDREDRDKLCVVTIGRKHPVSPPGHSQIYNLAYNNVVSEFGPQTLSVCASLDALQMQRHRCTRQTTIRIEDSFPSPPAVIDGCSLVWWGRILGTKRTLLVILYKRSIELLSLLRRTLYPSIHPNSQCCGEPETIKCTSETEDDKRSRWGYSISEASLNTKRSSRLR